MRAAELAVGFGSGTQWGRSEVGKRRDGEGAKSAASLDLRGQVCQNRFGIIKGRFIVGAQEAEARARVTQMESVANGPEDLGKNGWIGVLREHNGPDDRIEWRRRHGVR